MLMKPWTLVLILATVLAVNASTIHDLPSLAARHAQRAHRNITPASKPLTRRCKPRAKTNKPTSNNAADASTPPTTHNTNTSNNGGGSGGGGGGVINVSSKCGPIGATAQTTTTSGPNGSLNWLNCGIENEGWQPPYIQVHDLKVKNLQDVVNSGNSPFTACRAFIDMFERYGNQFGIPPIMLASFAMQESSCKPETVGGGGEQGLMQITRDKCGDAPGGNCRDPDFNIRTGAKFFANLLAGNGGDVLLSIGSYNGWHRGLTMSKATAAASSSCCRCQNNLDYLHQFVNGWLQNINAYDNSRRLGQYFNLDQCN